MGAAVDDHQISQLSWSDGATFAVDAERPGADAGPHRQRLQRGESASDQQLELTQRRPAVVRPLHSGIGAEGQRAAVACDGLHVTQQELPSFGAWLLEFRRRRLVRVRVEWMLDLPAARLRLVHRQRGGVEGPLLLEQPEQLLVDRGVPDPMHQHVDSRAHGDLRFVQSHRVREHLDAMAVRLLHDRRQGVGAHAGQIGSGSVPPAVGEDLEAVGAVSHQAADGSPTLLGRHHLSGYGFIVPALGAVSAGGAHAEGEVHPGSLEDARAHQPPRRLDHLGRAVEVNDGGDPEVEVRLQEAAVVRLRTPGRLRAEVRVQIEEPRQQGLALGRHHRRARGRLQPGAHGLDALVPDEDVGLDRGLARAVEDLSARDEDRLGPSQRCRQKNECRRQFHYRYLSYSY